MSRTTSVFVGPILKCEALTWPAMEEVTLCSANKKHRVEEGSSFCPVCGATANTKQVESKNRTMAFTIRNIEFDDYYDDSFKEKGIHLTEDDVKWLNENFAALQYDEDDDVDIIGFTGGGGFFVDADDDETEEQELTFHLPTSQEIERLRKLMKYGKIRSMFGTNVSVSW